MNTFSKIVSLLPLVLVSFLFVSCGKPKIVKNVTFAPSIIDSQIWGKMNAELYFGNISFPNVDLPIIHPKDLSNIGNLNLSFVNGKNLLEINVNLSEVTRLNTEVAKLPNGGTLPLMGNNQVIDLKIPGAKDIHFYLSVSEMQMALGVAFSLSNLDQLGQRVGQTSLFPVFQIGQISGAAGVYTSRNVGQNGFGIFADFSNIVNSQMKADLFTSSEGIKVQAQTSSNESAINDELYKLHRSNTRLRLAR